MRPIGRADQALLEALALVGASPARAAQRTGLHSTPRLCFATTSKPFSAGRLRFNRFAAGAAVSIGSMLISLVIPRFFGRKYFRFKASSPWSH